MKKYTVRYRDNGAIVIVCSDGRESEPVGYQGIARLDHMYATSEYFAGCLPRLFEAKDVEVGEG